MSDGIAFRLAHDLSDRIVATWSPGLIRAARVLVPIQLDALVVREPGGAWADTALREPALPEDGVQRRDLLPPPFSELPDGRQPGVYLHWALPDGLTRGEQRESNGPNGAPEVSFPSIPDRWLIARISPAAVASRRAVYAWILEAGGNTPVVSPLDGWTEPGPLPDGHPNRPQRPLSALGHGDPAWAAYYDNVVDRLGFYDDLGDVPAGPVAYLVCGWYAPPGTDDPLADAKVRSLADFYRRLADLNWQLAAGELEEAVRHVGVHVDAARFAGLSVRTTLPREAVAPTDSLYAEGIAFRRGSLSPDLQDLRNLDVKGDPVDPNEATDDPYVTDGSWWPKQTVYHGAAVGIGWPHDGFSGNEDGNLSTEEGGPPREADLTIAVGSTLAETLGIVVAHANSAPSDARVVEAFQLGAFRELDRADGRARLDGALHASAFASLPGGPETTETIRKPAVGQPPPSPKPRTPEPGIFARRPKPPPPSSRGRIEPHELTTEVGRIVGATHTSAARRAESIVLTGGLRAVLGDLGIDPGDESSYQPPSEIEVARSLPRFFLPQDPVILIQGARRTFRHGGDDRFAAGDALVCRLSGFCVTELAPRSVTEPALRVGVSGDAVLERGLENGSIPPECEDLLREAVLADPGSSSALAAAAQGSTARPADQRRFLVEQTAWWALRNPSIDASSIVGHSGYRGMLPCPIAVTPPQRPWNPVHLEWRIEWVPSPGGVSDWGLGELDYDLTALPAEDLTGIVLEGRSTLTGGAAATAAAAARKALEDSAQSGSGSTSKVSVKVRYASEIARAALLQAHESLGEAVKSRADAHEGGVLPSSEQAVLQTIVSMLDGLDVLAGGLEGFHARLRQFVPAVRPAGEEDALTAPPGLTALRAGHVRLLRLRLVDGFGQFVDLAGSDDAHDPDPGRILVGETVDVPDRPGVAALPPRFTAPARLWLRFADAATDRAEGDMNPVCGFLMPDHLDGACEFFDAAGGGRGNIRSTDDGSAIWEDAPGQPATVGQDPKRAIPNARLAAIAQGLLDWGIANAAEPAERDDALRSLLRVIDSTLWSVDPFGHVGDEHLGLLIGHPVAVLRAVVNLEVQDPANPPENPVTRVAVRLGALTQWDDGLLGFFVNDNYTRLYCAQAAAEMAREVGPGVGYLQSATEVQAFHNSFAADLPDGATPVTHPYVNGDAVIWVRPGQDVKLTLLVEPHAVVHATAGLVPRKEIGVRREWVAAGLARLSPTFRFGPVLVDPKAVRMPVATEISGSWSWDHREDVVAWVEDEVADATQNANLGDTPARASEGWLRLAPPDRGEPA